MVLPSLGSGTSPRSRFLAWVRGSTWGPHGAPRSSGLRSGQLRCIALPWLRLLLVSWSTPCWCPGVGPSLAFGTWPLLWVGYGVSSPGVLLPACYPPSAVPPGTCVRLAPAWCRALWEPLCSLGALVHLFDNLSLLFLSAFLPPCAGQSWLTFGASSVVWAPPSCSRSSLGRPILLAAGHGLVIRISLRVLDAPLACFPSSGTLAQASSWMGSPSLAPGSVVWGFLPALHGSLASLSLPPCLSQTGGGESSRAPLPV